jgi:cytochrome d ubiquinol oxidase subunit I
MTSLGGFVLFYTALAVIDVFLMLKFVRKGPDGLGIWPSTDGSLSPAGRGLG